MNEATRQRLADQFVQTFGIPDEVRSSFGSNGDLYMLAFERQIQAFQVALADAAILDMYGPEQIKVNWIKEGF